MGVLLYSIEYIILFIQYLRSYCFPALRVFWEPLLFSSSNSLSSKYRSQYSTVYYFIGFLYSCCLLGAIGRSSSSGQSAGLYFIAGFVASFGVGFCLVVWDIVNEILPGAPGITLRTVVIVGFRGGLLPYKSALCLKSSMI